MPVLSMVIEAIIGIGVSSTWDTLKRRETIIKLLKRFDIDPENPPSDFEGIYAYTLVEYGVYKPEPVLNFFRNEFVREAFKKSFYENNFTILEKEAEGIIQWNEETGKLGRIDYDPRREFATFTLVFNHLVSYSRTPSEVNTDQKIDSVLEQLENIEGQGLTAIREQLVKLTEYVMKSNQTASASSEETFHVQNSLKNNRVRWLHLSDFHVGKDNYGQRRLFKHLLDHIQARVEDGQVPDMIFITGDIANKGKKDEYEEFNDNFFVPLYDMLPPDSQERIFLVPGNHDVDRAQARAAQTYDVLLRIPEFLDPGEGGQFERKTILPRFRAFTEHDYTNLEDEHWIESQDGSLSKILQIKGCSFGISCVNTAWLSSSDNDRHQLSLGRHLLEQSLEKIDDCDFKLVLGHHPLDWLLDTELEPMRAILGRNAALYLHGHVHKGRAYYEKGAGYPFISLQAGACFQAREDELWVNRFLWCELDVETRELWIEPLQWARANQEWILDSDAFPERYRQGDRWVISIPDNPEIPLVSRKALKPDVESLEIPDGWALVDSVFLASRDVGLEYEQALSFFNGREPIWREALAPQIPRRGVVSQLVSALEEARSMEQLCVTLLTGAAGEGKSTALLQAVVDLILSGKNWQVLWHYDTITPLPSEVIVRLPESNGTWLIISDDAEIVAKRTYAVVKELRSQNRKDIQFLLCARDTDWMAEQVPTSSKWRQYTQYNEFNMRGITEDDAGKIITAWEAYGQEGLQLLDGLERSEAIQRLVDAARSEVGSDEGAFLGAMLQVRWGDEFSKHIEDLLQKLDKQIIPNTDLTLMNAFAYITACHAENIHSLSRILLSGVLGVPQNSLKRWVLGPLGEEAAIATTGKFIYTRHRAIADTTMSILSEQLYDDIDILFIDLVQTALDEYNSGGFIPSLRDWRYLSDYFFSQGRDELGIRLAQAACSIAPEDSFLVAKLAQLYRKVGQPEQGVRVFREWSGDSRNNRAFFSEWGAVEGNIDNYGLNVWLLAYSLADQASRTPPNNNDAKICLAGISYAFAELFERYNRDEFSQACGATARLGLSLSLDYNTKNWLNKSLERAISYGVNDVSLNNAIVGFQNGVLIAWEQREKELTKIQAATELTFNGLRRLLQIT